MEQWSVVCQSLPLGVSWVGLCRLPRAMQVVLSTGHRLQVCRCSRSMSHPATYSYSYFAHKRTGIKSTKLHFPLYRSWHQVTIFVYLLAFLSASVSCLGTIIWKLFSWLTMGTIHYSPGWREISLHIATGWKKKKNVREALCLRNRFCFRRAAPPVCLNLIQMEMNPVRSVFGTSQGQTKCDVKCVFKIECAGFSKYK